MGHREYILLWGVVRRDQHCRIWKDGNMRVVSTRSTNSAKNCAHFEWAIESTFYCGAWFVETNIALFGVMKT